MKRICVFAGSNDGVRPAYPAAAEELGRVLAGRGIGVVYGGARVGLMGALADSALAAGGQVTGVIPEALMAKEVAHTGLTELRVVGSMHERKALMADLADGFIALPGGWGTLDELFEVLTWAQLGLHGKPVGLLNVAGYFDGLLAFIGHGIEEGFVRREYRGMISVAESAAPLLALMAAYEAPRVEKWIDAASTSRVPPVNSTYPHGLMGVDGCKAGWLCVEEAPPGQLRAFIAQRTSDLLARSESVRIIALDIPIGLSSDGVRTVDAKARARLGPRASSVFPAPVRPVLDATNYEDACAASFAARRKKISRQSWAIVPKIREVDSLMRSSARAREVVREVHPELCFCAWNGGRPMQHPKGKADGASERQALVEAVWPGAFAEARKSLGRGGYEVDDLADAFAALWTARRVVAGDAWHLPDMPETDAFGLPMEMWA